MKQFFLNLLKLAFSFITIVSIIAVWMTLSYYVIKVCVPAFSVDTSTDTSTTETVESTEEDCNVYGINLHGDVITYHTPDSFNSEGDLMFDQTSADVVMRLITEAENDDDIKYVIVEISSSGGSPAAGFEMMQAFRSSTKPVVAFARDGAMSAAYLAATGAQTIFASHASDIGSIGVTASYLENVEQNKKEGLKYIDLSVGKFKDTMNPNRALTNEEKQLIMRDIVLLNENFIKTVAENRKLDIKKVRLLADGSTMMGEDALKNGLIDKIGNLYDVEDFVKDKIGEEVNICWKN